MNQETNGIHSSLPSPVKSTIQILNRTKTQEILVTANKNPVLEHVISTDLRNDNDIYGLLGFGDLSDRVTQTMICTTVVGSLLLIIIWYMFIRQIPRILGNTPTKYLARTLILCGVYSIVGSAALVSLIVYRASVFCDSVCHFAFTLCAYQYFQLVIDYAGGESNFMKNTQGTMVFNMQTPPLCCCLRFLLPSAITKKKFKILRMMVLQMPIIQGILLALLNVFNSISTSLYEQMLMYISFFMISSIFLGVWSLQINSRMIAAHLPELRIIPKYFAIQLVLILYKLQPLILRQICYAIELLFDQHINSKVVQNALIQVIILLETTFLSYFANRAYSVPTKASEPN